MKFILKGIITLTIIILINSIQMIKNLFGEYKDQFLKELNSMKLDSYLKKMKMKVI